MLNILWHKIRIKWNKNHTNNWKYEETNKMRKNRVLKYSFNLFPFFHRVGIVYIK